MQSLNKHNKSSKDLYKSEDSTFDKVLGAVAFIAFVLIVALSGCIEADPIPTPTHKVTV
jgi:hypothetical protein